MKTKTTITKKFLIHCLSLLLIFCSVTVLFPTSASAITTDTYSTISNIGTGKVLNVHGNGNADGTRVTLWDNDGTTGVHWKLVNRGSYYVIIPQCAADPSRVLNILATNKANNGNKVSLWHQTGHSTQGWIIEPVSSGYILRSANNTNLVLSANGSERGNNVLVKTYNPSDRLQIWNSSLFGGPVQPTTNNSSLMWPLAGGAGRVTAPAGQIRGGYIHVGTDIGAPAGTPIVAVSSGTVKAVGCDGVRGNFIVIEHGNYWCVYQHMKSQACVGKGANVTQGQTIGHVGSTGHSTGPHLHFEIALTSSLSKSGSPQNYIYNDVNTAKRKITYYSVSKGANNTLNLNKV